VTSISGVSSVTSVLRSHRYTKMYTGDYSPLEILGAMVVASGIEPGPGQNDTLNKLIIAAKDEANSLGRSEKESLGEVQYQYWHACGSPNFELKERI